MDSDDDFDIEGESEEALEHETVALAALRSVEGVVFNNDGTLRCPICSPSKRKQSYAYTDLLQHAAAVALGKRGPEAAGKHSALKKYLESDLLHLAPPPAVHRALPGYEVPRRREAEDSLVCPWSVVVHNLFDTSQHNPDQDVQIGFGKNEVRNHFAEFRPDKVHVFWGSKGHLGIGVLQFGRELSGLSDALALERYFIDQDRGLKEYNAASAFSDLGEGIYGWVAREDDVLGRSGLQGEQIAKYLQTYGDLKKMATVGQETTRIHDQQVQQLSDALAEKSKECLSLKAQIGMVRRNAEADGLQLDDSLKRGFWTGCRIL